MLMRIAEYIDTSAEREGLREWFLPSRDEVLDLLAQEEGRVATFKEQGTSRSAERYV